MLHPVHNIVSVMDIENISLIITDKEECTFNLLNIWVKFQTISLVKTRQKILNQNSSGTILRDVLIQAGNQVPTQFIGFIDDIFSFIYMYLVGTRFFIQVMRVQENYDLEMSGDNFLKQSSSIRMNTLYFWTISPELKLMSDQQSVGIIF